MDASLNRKSLAFGIPGILLQIVGNVMVRVNEGPDPDAVNANQGIGLLILLVGTVLLIVGLSFYARAKGRSGWWGLMGLLSIIGLIVLALLKDYNKDGGRAAGARR